MSKSQAKRLAVQKKSRPETGRKPAIPDSSIPKGVQIHDPTAPLNTMKVPLTLVELAVAKGDVRYYLNYVYLDLRVPKAPMLVATNGHFLIAVPVKPEANVKQGPIPVDAIKAARKANKREPVLVFENGMVGTRNVMFRRPDDVTWPDWRKASFSTDEAPFAGDVGVNGAYLAAINKAMGSQGLRVMLGRDKDGAIDPAKPLRVRANGRGAEVERNEGVIAVVMPMRF